VQFGRHGLFDDSLRGVDRAERHIIVCFAGQLAQRKYAPHSRWRSAGGHDRAIAMELFWHVTSPDEKARNLQLALLWRKAELLVQQHWKTVQGLADALLERKTLTGKELRDVIWKLQGLKPIVIGQAMRQQPEGAHESTGGR
jgi:hypothetical protein